MEMHMLGWNGPLQTQALWQINSASKVSLTVERDSWKLILTQVIYSSLCLQHGPSYD